MENDVVDVEFVEAEIVEPGPSKATPLIEFAMAEELPKDPVRAPAPEELFREKRRGARRKYASPEQMQEDIDRYFASCVRAVTNPINGKIEHYWIDPPTVPGLARALNMTSQTVMDYQRLDEFEAVITEAKLIIEEYTAKALHKNPKATGLIFILKNMGWQDNKTITYAPPNRLEAAKTPEQIAEVIQQDIVD